MFYLKMLGAFLLGMVVGGSVNMALIQINLSLYPAPEGMDMNDMVAWKEFAASLPPAAFLIPVIAHLAQAFLGGWVAARIAPSHVMGVALTIGGVSMLGGIMNLINLAPPAWMWAELPFYLVLAGLAGKLELKRRSSLAGSDKASA
ncbi:MAG: hypothetical protein ACPG1Z_04070 [Planctomycetota bacterium]